MATSKELKVGAFVLAGLIVAGIVVFLIGEEKRLFESKMTFHSSFSDVQGLKTGAPVRLGGIDIGNVFRITHAENASDPRLYVDMHIVKREASRIRKDTVARISNKGLLGDKMIELTVGSQSAQAIVDDGFINGEDPTDFSNVFAQAGAIAQHAEKVLSNLEVTTQSLADATMQQDLRGSVHSVNLILKQVAEGNGYVHRLLTDPAEAERMSHLVASLDRTASEFQATAIDARKVLVAMNDGPGFAHELLHGDKGNQALANFGGVAGELAVTLRGIRDGNGLAHSIIYGGDEPSQQVAANLGAITGDLRQIMADLRAGKGTLGALLVDPSVYEDVKGVLGNVQRNDALRALVRYSIKQDEKHPETQVSEKAPARVAQPR